MTGGDLEAMESRVGVGGVSDAPQYKTMMSTMGAGAGQQRYGQSRLRGGAESLNNLWYQYGLAANNGQMGQNTFASRKGVAAGGAGGGSNAGAGLGASNQFVSYDYDYGDYGAAAGGGGATNLGGAANRRFSQYANYDYPNYGGLSRGYGASGAGAGGVSGLGVGYGGGYSPVSVVSGYGPSVCEDKGLNPALVLATLAGAALAFFIIYRQITQGGKRNLSPTANDFIEHVSNLVWSGKSVHDKSSRPRQSERLVSNCPNSNLLCHQ